ncbi:hypothetical protein [Streptomyces phytophilus]|uniref:hypothetical protein n=1 Tax=Streptomyces phytophilus TaxID=722715 RepID=UPI0015F034AF|nr:hypothetical protein [Streptomyces phytophilus]
MPAQLPVYFAFGGMNMYAATGEDRQTKNRFDGFRRNARWHQRAPWQDHDVQDIADRYPRDRTVAVKDMWTTQLNPGANGNRDAILGGIRKNVGRSSCMVALLARDPRYLVADRRNAAFLRYELRVAVHAGMDVYLMRRSDTNWYSKGDVAEYLALALDDEWPGRGHKPRLRVAPDREIECWDSRKWAYPGMSSFLDRQLSARKRR